MIKQVRKRDGILQEYNKSKIADAIFKSAVACGGDNRQEAEKLADMVEGELIKTFEKEIPSVEQIQDIVEKVLIENRHAQVAKSYILYREKRSAERKLNALTAETLDLFSKYLDSSHWSVKENSNTGRSVAGLNNYVREAFTKNYWLSQVYPKEIKEAHESGAIHIHDLGFFGSYCVGWDLRQILTDGYTGVPDKVSSKPPKHFRSFLGQIVNATYTTQCETAGAQAWSSFDTYCAPFIRLDNLNFKQVKQALQEFIFNMNVPTRTGFQCPFSNITLDIKCPNTLKNQPIIVGGKPQNTTYGEYQNEMDTFNKALFEVMLEGDSNGRVFSFPIPTINITKNFDWDSDVVDSLMEITCKYGIPYFANYVNSDLSPEDAISMCCRLRLDVSELRKRGGGLFGSNPLTGSIGVVTLNLARIGYLANDENEYFTLLNKYCDIAKKSLEIKRKVIENQTEKGLYPYSAYYLRQVKKRTGGYWANHFNTIGIIGMNESLINFMNKNITTDEGLSFALKVMHYLREKMIEYQKETGNQYNLEATPAEGASARLAKLDKLLYPDIKQAGKEAVSYTNSTQIPVEYSDDIFEVVKLQDELQSLYTGGTVLHLYLGEKIEDKVVCKNLIKKIFSTSKMPYISITPTFSVCSKCGYIAGEHFTCPKCNGATEVWSRVVGYLRPVQDYNDSKSDEYKNRKKFVIKNDC